MFNYRLIINNEIVGEYQNTVMEFDRLSPPQQDFILSDEMLADIKDGKYNSRFYLISNLENEADSHAMDDMYNILKPFEGQENISFKIQVSYQSDSYTTILTASSINYVVRVSRYDTTSIVNKDLRFYNQISFLCNVE